MALQATWVERIVNLLLTLPNYEPEIARVSDLKILNFFAPEASGCRGNFL